MISVFVYHFRYQGVFNPKTKFIRHKSKCDYLLYLLYYWAISAKKILWFSSCAYYL